MDEQLASLSLSLATSRFCEAILDFLADQKRASEANIRAADFEGEAYSIYELFSTVWLQSKEAKVIFIVCDCVHAICSNLMVTLMFMKFHNSVAAFGGCRGNRLHCTPCLHNSA